MNQIPFRNQPAFRGVLLAVVLLGIFAYYAIWKGGILANLAGMLLDVLFVFLLYQACVFFYAQFILPTRSLEERRRIADRLQLHAAGGHGPAIFVKNGRKVERTGESEMVGPGLLWVDTASAVVTRTFATFKQVLGPGVHFMEANERIASIVSLHAQTQTIGPTGLDKPFEPLKTNPTDDERRQHDEMVARCLAVRATTRDGIEVIPTISISFKIDAKPAGRGERGSRFGFNADAVERAARSEGINPNSPTEEKRHVAWNQLPGLMAAELWREYLSKFTLNELFEANLKPAPDIRQPEVPPATVAAPPPPQLIVRHNLLSRWLRNFNNGWERELNALMPPEEPVPQEELPPAQAAAPARGEPPRKTALQIINQMMKARLSQAIVVKLDDCGRLTDGQEVSGEYRKLNERGIAVLGASVTALHLDPAVERQLLSRWTTSWLSNAHADRARIERLELAYTEQGRHQALLDHALELAEALNKENPGSVTMAVKALLQSTEAEIRANDRLLGRGGSELETLQGLEKWLEEKQQP
ncbi:MAG: hypothetical protein ACM3MF_07955 [Anaerolineae bacterium]